VNGRELWRTDGTTTTMVQNINPGGADSFPIGFTPLGGFLYFGANSPNGREVWRTNGATTTEVQNIAPGPDGSDPFGFTELGGRLYFAADDSTTGNELWRTDGTTTSLVADIRPGPERSDLSQLTPYGNSLYFAARGGKEGLELWRTDGSTTGLAKDILAGTDDSEPGDFVPFADSLYFSADDGEHGREIWRVAPDPPPDATARVKIKGKKLKLDRKGVAKLKLVCPASEANPPCAGSLSLKTAKKVDFKGKRRKVKLDRGDFSLGAGEAGKVKLKLSGAELDLLSDVAKARKLKAAAKVTDGVGNKATVSKQLKADLPGA